MGGLFVDKGLFRAKYPAMQGSRVAIIGAGLGGMSAAISLRAAGYEVEVFEKNSSDGG